ncbi:ANTAR domain-containing response regulator [Methylophilus methylotrophus]|uniref:ANTAR domain-containing response regulator n=1 Tax=Methylophilus methylotrophus TaxID=17 RepID=UPI0003796EF0|nr:response regulator [Methylophilus methylotrophus]
MSSEKSLQQNKASILLVDDDRLILATMATGLMQAGYEVNTTESVDEAEAWLESNPRPDIAIIDINMPNRSGLELPASLDRLDYIPFIFLTARSEPEVNTQANALGAMAYLVKPIDSAQLIPAIQTALSRAKDFKHMKSQQQQLQTALDGDRSVSIAIGIIMDQYRISYEEANTMLRNNARSKRIKLVDFATSIIHSRESLNLENDS